MPCVALSVWHLCAAALAVINEWGIVALDTLSVRKRFNLEHFSTGHGKLCQFGSGLIWEILVLDTGNSVSFEAV